MDSLGISRQRQRVLKITTDLQNESPQLRKSAVDTLRESYADWLDAGYIAEQEATSALALSWKSETEPHYKELKLQALVSIVGEKNAVKSIRKLYDGDYANLFPRELFLINVEDIEKLFSKLPDEPLGRLEEVGDRFDEIRRVAIVNLQPTLNAYLQTQTERPLSYQEKQSIVDIVNTNLDKFGLAIRFKGQLCNFAATVGKDYPSGRFLLAPKGSKTPLLARVNLADFLPLELTDAQPRREPLNEWRERESVRRQVSEERSVTD